MRKLLIKLFLIAFCVINIFAGVGKDYNAEFDIDPGQKINIRTVSGMNVKVISWDNNVVKFDLRVEISSSDDDYENEYIEKFKIVENRGGSFVELRFEEAEGGSWSFFDIFRLKFNYYIDKKITGTIYVPKLNSLNADFKYSEIKLEDLQGLLELPGRSNEILLTNCTNIGSVQNDYGNTELINCKGKLNLESRSAELQIKNFDGNADIKADYMDIWLDEVMGSAKISSRSGNLEARNIHGDLEINAPYTDIKVYDVDGFTAITDRSEDIFVCNSNGLFIEGPYCNMDISGITDTKSRSIIISGRSGSINMAKILGDVDIDDQYSSINLNDIKGSVDLVSRSETILCSSITGDINFDTEYCDITIEKLNAKKVWMENRSGGIEIWFLNNPTDVTIHNEYGSVRLELLADYEGEYELVAKHGEIDSSFPLHIREKGSQETAKGRIGNKDNKIYIETRSDNIIISRK